MIALGIDLKFNKLKIPDPNLIAALEKDEKQKY